MIVVALSLYVLIVFCGDRITQANVDRIQYGMSFEQVTEILGSPSKSSAYSFASTDYVWVGKNNICLVQFENGGVIEKGIKPTDRNWWSRVRRFIGL